MFSCEFCEISGRLLLHLDKNEINIKLFIDLW